MGQSTIPWPYLTHKFTVDTLLQLLLYSNYFSDNLSRRFVNRGNLTSSSGASSFALLAALPLDSSIFFAVINRSKASAAPLRSALREGHHREERRRYRVTVKR